MPNHRDVPTDLLRNEVSPQLASRLREQLERAISAEGPTTRWEPSSRCCGS
jgi:hypothetical protein